MPETFRLPIGEETIQFRLVGEPRRMRGGKSRYFEQRFRILGQKRQTVSLRTTDRRVASRRARETVEERIRTLHFSGQGSATKSLRHHIRDFLADLKADGCCDKHVSGNKEHHLHAVVGYHGWDQPSQINATDIKTYLSRRRDAGEIGWQTSRHYCASMKSFTRWLCTHGRMEKDPLVCLRLEPRGDTPRVVHRRAFTDAEFQQLVMNATNSDKVVRRLSGRDRAILYVTARFTGLRAQELASLLPSHLRLGDHPPTIRLDRQVSKRRRHDTIILSVEMAELLASLVAGNAQDEPLWPGRWYDRAAEVMRVDMDGIEVENARGVLQFHSLRHTHVTDVVRTGATIAEVLRICRLSTPSLLDRYYHSSQEEQRAICEKLPKPALPS